MTQEQIDKIKKDISKRVKLINLNRARIKSDTEKIINYKREIEKLKKLIN